MKADKYLFDGSEKCDVKKLPNDSKKDDVVKDKIIKQFENNIKLMPELHDKFYADGREGLIILIQAIDAAGKDSTVKHVVDGMNPAGVYVYSFKQPSKEELKHDYLWRFNKCLPERGAISVFNRSYYEDVLTVKIHDIWKTYQMPERVLKDDKKEFFKKRYEQIRNYEEYLYENGYRIVKILLNVSKDEQKERFLERLERPEKNWKFSAFDLQEREIFDTYVENFSLMVNETATKHCPWYVLPADQKWYTRYLASEIINHALKECKSQYPELPDEQKAHIEDYIAELKSEKKGKVVPEKTDANASASDASAAPKKEKEDFHLKK